MKFGKSYSKNMEEDIEYSDWDDTGSAVTLDKEDDDWDYEYDENEDDGDYGNLSVVDKFTTEKYVQNLLTRTHPDISRKKGLSVLTLDLNEELQKLDLDLKRIKLENYGSGIVVMTALTSEGTTLKTDDCNESIHYTGMISRVERLDHTFLEWYAWIVSRFFIESNMERKRVLIWRLREYLDMLCNGEKYEENVDSVYIDDDEEFRLFLVNIRAVFTSI